MPLDPLFAERLHAHRRYLIDQALGDLKGRLSWMRRPAKTAAAPSAAAASAGAPSESSAPASAPAASAPTAQSPPRTPSPREARARHRRAAIAWDRTELRTVGTPGPDIPTTEHVVPVTGYPDVLVRIYRPDAQGLIPACLTLYGGAFRIGGIDYPTTDAAARRRAAASGVAIVSVDYALAPEHRYPTQVEQVYAAFDWMIRNADELGIDAERVGVAGTSAGGCLAAALTLMNRDRAGHPIRLQILEVPVVDLTGRHIDLAPTRAVGIPSILALREMWSVRRTYLGRTSRAREPYASPLLAGGHAGLPPALILTAEYDPLRGEGAAYAAALRAAGVEASAVRYLGVTHDIPIFTGALAAARRWEAEVVGALRTLHGAQQSSLQQHQSQRHAAEMTS
ncbi:alpha/beta hydrolase [Microbacterium sp. ASV49]|uniref:Alpha/beta hydrolase n=1 Tax=Microbacterium candidum TaxID=3041922 RepID=A0ABT7MTN6_9MICO|nr:alpha/beta hydrolase [Microbacterium sp. ASV49]MDL9977819.1 alpha/beta hydrolase [Microbacterium sp. ASV49]